MMHAKTAVADGRWARVGSTNLNVSSWMGNYELDVAVEDEVFAGTMEEMYLEDLSNSTEIVLGEHGVRPWGTVLCGRSSKERGRQGYPRRRRSYQDGSAVGAAMTNRRVLGLTEAKTMGVVGSLLLCLSVVFVVWPKWIGIPVGSRCVARRVASYPCV